MIIQDITRLIVLLTFNEPGKMADMPDFAGFCFYRAVVIKEDAV